jgi:putative sterol carrier protein
MAAELFGEDWARAWREEIAASEAYRSAAASWEGAMVFAMTADEASGVPGERRVYLDLWHGDCRDARAAADADVAAASYVVTAAPAVWREVLEGRVEPLFAVMSGKLKLVRGSIARLLPYVTAARELLAAARRVPTEFPHAWSPGQPA